MQIRIDHEDSFLQKVTYRKDKYGETNSFFPWLTAAARKVENFTVFLRRKKQKKHIEHKVISPDTSWLQ